MFELIVMLHSPSFKHIQQTRLFAASRNVVSLNPGRIIIILVYCSAVRSPIRCYACAVNIQKAATVYMSLARCHAAQNVLPTVLSQLLELRVVF
jgi:hypothetical protein